MKIPIVDENDNIIKNIDTKDRKPHDICRVTGLWITDPSGDILLAQRAFSKKHSPGSWGPAVAGTVEEGETYESNIIKEAEEELGLKNIKPIFGKKFLRHTSHRYFVQWFSLTIPKNTPIKIQENEVAQAKWFTRKEINDLMEKNSEIFLSNLKERMDNL